MESKKLIALQKRGQAGMEKSLEALLGLLVVLTAIGALAPEIFTSLAGLESDADVPTWVSALLFIFAGIGLVFLTWRVIKGRS